MPNITPAGPVVDGKPTLRVSRNLKRLLDSVPVQKHQKNMLPFSITSKKLQMHERVRINPEMARYLLSLSGGNRTISENRVKGYADDMRRGAWRHGVDYIRLSQGGHLKQGHHTLFGVLMSGAAIEMMVQIGVDDDMADKIDQGRPWKFADIVASAQNNENPRMTATVARLLWLYENNEPPFSTNTSTVTQNREILTKYEAEITEAVSYVNGLKDIFFRRNSLAWLYAIQAPFNKEKVIEFLEGVATGANLPEGDARLLLRNRLLEGKGGSKSKTLRRTAEFVLVSDAWSLFLERGDRERLRLSPKVRSGKHLRFRGFAGLPEEAPSRYRRAAGNNPTGKGGRKSQRNGAVEHDEFDDAELETIAVGVGVGE